MTVTSLNKSALANLYKISPYTFRAWCVRAKLFEPDYFDKVRIFNPKEVRLIFNHFGEPETEFE